MTSRQTNISEKGLAVVCADKGMFYPGPKSAIAWTGATFRQQHTITCDVIGLRLVFHNWVTNGSPPHDSVTFDGAVAMVPITVTASIETGPYPGDIGTFSQVKWNGATSIVIQPGTEVLSDVVYVSIAKGATFFTRTFVAEPNGKWPVGMKSMHLISEGVHSVDDYTMANAVNMLAEYQSYGPSAILGMTAGTVAKVGYAVLGSSTAQGYTDFFDSGQVYGGFLPRALVREGVGFITLACSSSVMQDGSLGYLSMRMMLAKYCQGAILAWQTNDITNGRTLANMQADIAAVVALLKAQGVSRVYLTTINPYTTSTDNWATVVNQTLFYAGATAGKEVIRQAFNAWARSSSVLSVVDGVFDTAATVEDGGASAPTGKWWANGTAFAPTLEGLHAATASHILMAAAVTGQGLGLMDTLGNVAVRDTVVVGSVGGYDSGLASIVAGASLTWHKGDTGPGAFIATLDSTGANIDVSAYYSSVSVVFQRQGQTDLVQAAAFANGIPLGGSVAVPGVSTGSPPTDIPGNMTVLVRFVTPTGIIETAPNPLTWIVRP